MSAPVACERESAILALWERGAGLGRWAREDALLLALGPSPSALGARNAALLRLRGHLFGRAWPLRSRCTACAADCEFMADCGALADRLSALARSSSTAQIELGDRSIALRAPTVDDLREIAVLPDEQSAATALLARCASDVDTLDALDERDVAELSAQLDRLDPSAVLSFALSCPTCGHDWSAAIDIGCALWSELQRAAERALIEIDALARAYGWTERDVLSLSPVRRAAYLQLAGAA
ncbi:MAG: hypothetical protein ACXWVE_07335 [Rhodoplanes sp.]